MLRLEYIVVYMTIAMLPAYQLAYCADKWCPDGMILNGDKCFEAYLEREAPYFVAKEICKENGGQVALGYNFEITNILARIALKHRFENYWVQSDEKVNSDQCQATMHRNDFEISTEHCNNAMFYICQFDFEVSNSSKYENGYFQFSEDRNTFSGAQQSCANLGGKIAAVDNKDVLNCLKEVINKDLTWQRFSDWQLENLQLSYYPNFWAGARFNTELEKWVCDFGTPVDSFQHLSQKDHSEKCIKFDKNSLEITDCEEYNYFFCQFPAENKPVSITSLDKSYMDWSRFFYMIVITLAIPAFLKIQKSFPKSSQDQQKQVHIANGASKKFPSNRFNFMKILLCVLVFLAAVVASQASESDTCLAGQFRFNGESCYEPRMKRATTFENANEICLDSGGKLAIIRDYITQEFLNRIALKTMYENFWVGNANVSSKDCIAIKSRDDYTQEKDHPDQNFFYICELDECSSPSCNIGKFNNKCYEMTMERSKCMVAKKSCENKGGRLAVIDAEEKFQFIQSLIYRNEWWTIVPNSVIDNQYLSDTPIFWSGMKFEQQSKKWTNVGGTQENLFYDYMFSDSDLKSDSDSCATSEFKLSDCDSYKYFFCEYFQSSQIDIVPMTFINILDQSKIGFVGTCTLFAILMISAVMATFIFFRKSRVQTNVVPVVVPKESKIKYKSYYQSDDGHQPLVHNMKL